MQLSPVCDDERRALREVVRDLLDRHADSAAVRAAMQAPDGFDRVLWSRLCREIGVAGLAVPARYGGAGASLLEMQAVLTELGCGLTPSPLLGSAVLAAQALLWCGDEDACARLLPGICAGARIATLLWVGPAGGWDPDVVACRVNDEGTLSGAAHHVLDAGVADILLVAAAGGAGIGLYEVDRHAAGVAVCPRAGLDLTRRLGTVRLDGVAGRRLGERNPLPVVRDVACAALAAEQVGAAARALAVTVEHARTRVQFGRPIGAFQALQHRLADLYVLLEAARSASTAAGAALVAGAPDAGVLAAAAKVYCSETLQAVAGEMVQLHGGIGITWEHDAHLYLRRAYAAAQLFGTPGAHVARLAGHLVA